MCYGPGKSCFALSPSVRSEHRTQPQSARLESSSVRPEPCLTSVAAGGTLPFCFSRIHGFTNESRPATSQSCCSSSRVHVLHSVSLHTGMRCKRRHTDTQLLVAQMVREHARSTAALDLAAAFWEQQSEGEPTLRGLVCLLSKTAEPHRAGIQPAVQLCALVAQFVYRIPMS